MKKIGIIGIVGIFSAIVYYLLKQQTDKVVTLPKRVGYLSEEKAQQLANRLFVAMNQLGTDEEELEAVRIEIETYSNEGAALRDVVNAFGLRPYIGGKAGIDLPSLGGSIGYKLDLFHWLKEELSAGDFVLWSQLFNRAGL